MKGNPPLVLVTGATGFIGRAVVRRLLVAGRRVVAVVRRHDGTTAVDRVAAAIGVVPDRHRLDAIEADLARPECALAVSDWWRLADSVETVIHCAGDTTFFPSAMAPFRAGHIEGPRYLLERLAAGRLRRWAHVSTAYVCGRRSGTILESERDVGQDFHNPYEQTKLESETALRLAGQRYGVDVRAFRPSIVVGPAPPTAGGNPSNLLFAFIRMVAALARLGNGRDIPLRVQAAPQARFNIVPLEYVAAAVVVLAELPDARDQTFHLVVADAPTQDDVLATITAYLGIRGLSLVDSGGAMENPSPLERRVAHVLSPYRDYLTQNVRFDDANARQCLGRGGLRSPLISPNDIRRLIDTALDGDVPGRLESFAGR